MRHIAFLAAALLFAAPADARQQNDYVPSEGVEGEYQQDEYQQGGSGGNDYADEARLERQLNDLDEMIDWLDQLEASLASGSLLLIRSENADGGMAAMYIPVDRDDVIRVIRIKVALGEMTSEQGASLLIVMAADAGRHRRQFRALRQRLADQRQALRRGGERPDLQRWERGLPPAQSSAPPSRAQAPQTAACPAATRWHVEVRGSQYSYTFMLVFRQDGSVALLMPSGDEMTWVQTQGRIGGDALTLHTRDANGSGSLTATLTPDCLRGTGQSQASNGNNGPAILTRLN